MKKESNTQTSKLAYESLFLKGSAISISTVVLIGVINLFLRRSLALHLSPTDYGFIYSIFSFLTILIALFDAGLGQSGVILIARHNAQNIPSSESHIFSTLFTTRLFLALVLTTAVLLSAESLSIHYFKKPEGLSAILIMSLWMAGMMMSGAITSLLEGSKDFIARQVFFLSNYGIALTLIVLLKQIMSPFLAGLSMAIGIGASCVIFLFYIKKQYHLPFLANMTSLKRHFPQILHLGKWVSISAAGIMIMFSMDSVMLTYYKGLRSVGLYNAAIPIMQVVLSIMLVFPQVFAPIATELWHHNHKRQLHKLLLTVTISVFVLTSIGLAILWPLRQLIISLLFSDDYSKAATVSLILIAGVPFFTASQMHLTILNSMNRQKTGAFLVLCALLINVLLNVILIPKYDIMGAGCATLLSYVSLLIASATVLWTSDKFQLIQSDN